VRDLARAGGRVTAVGIAVPGLVDETRGIARASVNIGWREQPLRDRLIERLGVPVVVLQDVRAAARAEGLLGAGRDCQSWLLITLGTGIGGAVVTDGRPFPGAHGTAGEIGHIVVAPDGPRCGCGAQGCVESVASAGALARRYGGGVTAQEVFELARDGDPRAAELLDDAIKGLAAALRTAVLLVDPERIVIGGGLAAAGAALFEPVEAELQRQLTFLAAPPVVPAALGADAGCHGAALAAWDVLE
jgi:glucokinase